MVRSANSPVQPPFRFQLPDELAAKEPPEKRGLTRDGVRLLSANRRSGILSHSVFNRIGDFLEPGDCLVFNASRTLPASLRAVAIPVIGASGPRDTRVGDGGPRPESPGVELRIRLGRRWENGDWSVLALSPDEEPWAGDLTGSLLIFASGGSGEETLSAQVIGKDPLIGRLWKIRFSRRGPALMETISRLGDPIRYWYAASPWNLDFYQTVFAREPGSVEMPSAGRAFTWKLLMDLRRKGVETAFLVLHAGLSSYMDPEFDSGHPASVESFRLDSGAANLINAAKSRGGRIVAVGTTVVRALETVADASGRVRAESGSTRLRITPGYSLRTVDGLVTGFHEPEASHLDLLSAFLPPERLRPIYEEAVRKRYLWHEFGDANLIL